MVVRVLPFTTGIGGMNGKCAVAYRKVQITVVINGRCSSRHPNTAEPAVRRQIECRLESQSGFIEAQEPAVVRTSVAMRSPGNINAVAQEHQTGPLVLTQGIELYVDTIAAITGAGNRHWRVVDINLRGRIKDGVA